MLHATSQIHCHGFCPCCQTDHTLPQGESKRHGLALLTLLMESGSIDLDRKPGQRDPALGLDHLFGTARGQMFGVMEYQRPDGSRGLARAFSGQYNGHWLVKGWVGPVFDVQRFTRLIAPVEAEIKALGHLLADNTTDQAAARQIKQQRKALSRQLMGQIHDLYLLSNFRGQRRPLKDVFLRPGGIPAGTADCCAPKLLHFAATNQLRPLSISEFYLGRENRSASRQHGRFYPPCHEKCQPILGFMLCGLE